MAHQGMEQVHQLQQHLLWMLYTAQSANCVKKEYITHTSLYASDNISSYSHLLKVQQDLNKQDNIAFS